MVSPLQVCPVTGQRKPRAAWWLLGGGHPVCPPGSRWPGQKSAQAPLGVHLARRAAAQDAALQRSLLCNSVWIQLARLASWGESQVFDRESLCWTLNYSRSRWPRDCRRGTSQPSWTDDCCSAACWTRGSAPPCCRTLWNLVRVVGGRSALHVMSSGYTVLRQSTDLEALAVWPPWTLFCWRPWKQTFHRWWGSSVSAWTISGSLLTCSTCSIKRVLWGRLKVLALVSESSCCLTLPPASAATTVWQTGVLYLDRCPVQGRQRAQLLL